ncbi:MAG TPA: O-antigen ligase family protein [Pseudomonadales bacterium]|nr:O-antigen ligase family protein [Pseudomonadales bacterium]
MYRSTLIFMGIACAFLVEIGSKISPEILYLRGKIGIVVLCLLIAGSLAFWRPLPDILKVFLLCSLLSLVPGMSTVTHAYGFMQVFLDFKFGMALVVTYVLASSHLVVYRMPRLVLAVMVFSSLLIMLEMLSPGLYRKIFPMTVMYTTVFGTDFIRATGFFTDASSFGMFCTVAVLYFFALWRYLGWNKVTGTGLVFSLLGLVMSGQRMEAGSALFGVVLFYALRKWKRPWLIGSVIFSVAVGYAAVGGIFDEIIGQFTKLYQDAESWSQFDPRLALLSGAEYLANYHFPFGSGLGTYGSSMSLINPDDAYFDAGTNQLWWYQQEDTPYLTDSYWAMVIGETGWFGFVLCFFSYAYLLFQASKKVAEAESDLEIFGSCLAFTTMTYGFLNSVASAVFVGSMVQIYFHALLYIMIFKKEDASV